MTTQDLNPARSKEPINHSRPVCVEEADTPHEVNSITVRKPGTENDSSKSNWEKDI